MNRVNPFAPVYKRLNHPHPCSSDMPILIDIEITNACNFNCLFCPTGTKAYNRPVGFMTGEMYGQIIDQIAPFKIPLRFIRWGEPTLHKNFVSYLRIAKDAGLHVHLGTNGSKLNEQVILQLLEMKLDSIKFSFQGVDEKTYSEMRYGQSYEELVDTVKLFYKMRGDLPYPFMHITTTVTYESPDMIKVLLLLTSLKAKEKTVRYE